MTPGILLSVVLLYSLMSLAQESKNYLGINVGLNFDRHILAATNPEDFELSGTINQQFGFNFTNYFATNISAGVGYSFGSYYFKLPMPELLSRLDYLKRHIGPKFWVERLSVQFTYYPILVSKTLDLGLNFKAEYILVTAPDQMTTIVMDGTDQYTEITNELLNAHGFSLSTGFVIRYRFQSDWHINLKSNWDFSIIKPPYSMQISIKDSTGILNEAVMKPAQSNFNLVLEFHIPIRMNQKKLEKEPDDPLTESKSLRPPDAGRLHIYQ